MTTNITLQPGESVTITAATSGGGGGGGQPPNPQPIPGVPLTLTLNGVVRDTVGLNTSQMTAVGSFVVPNTPGLASSFKCFEHGSASLWRWGWLAQDPSSIDPKRPMAQGAGGVNLPFAIGVDHFGTTKVMPGSVWWVVIRNQKFDGTPSCTQGLSCEMGYSMDVPS